MAPARCQRQCRKAGTPTRPLRLTIVHNAPIGRFVYDSFLKKKLTPLNNFSSNVGASPPTSTRSRNISPSETVVSSLMDTIVGDDPEPQANKHKNTPSAAWIRNHYDEIDVYICKIG